LRFTGGSKRVSIYIVYGDPQLGKTTASRLGNIVDNATTPPHSGKAALSVVKSCMIKHDRI